MSFAAPEPFKPTRNEKVAGLLLAIILAIAFFLFLKIEDSVNKQNWHRLVAELGQSYGIGKDAPIKLAGLTIGRVSGLKLSEQGKVVLTVDIDKTYSQFLDVGSHLQVDSQFGLNNVLTGSGLILVRGEGKTKLKNGDRIDVVEPTSLDQMLDDWNVKELSEQLTSILANLDKVVATVSENQANLTKTIENIGLMTDSLVETGEKLPPLMSGVERTLASLESTLNKLEPRMLEGSEQLTVALKSSNQLMQNLNEISTSLQQTTDKTPETLDVLNSTMIEVQALTSQLRSHWLLGGKEPEQIQLQPLQIVYPSDKTLYQQGSASEN